MEGPFGRCLSSPLFTFQVGPDKKEITVHSSALADLSQSLNTLINGEMLEAKSRRADWSDVDVDTFTRLCEFAYLRDYTPPSCRLIDGCSPIMETSKPMVKHKKRKKGYKFLAEPEPAPAPEVDLSAEEAPQPGSVELPYKERSVWTQHLHDIFQENIRIPASHKTSNSTQKFAPPISTGPWEDFSLVFVEQVQLYVLADKYGIEDLRYLVLSKLHQTLRSFKLYDDAGVAGIFEFVRFVYSNTPPDHGNICDPLRTLVALYVASVLGQIGEHEAFKELLEEGGAFVADFWRIVWSENDTPT
ncbi:uncharacterized protein N7506_007768 [Penicillium brevicompactum]|uniref:uncharacterized protein n=1 Tax=Penicillium brevicompactum TaxID=5074 RepID=UPI0025416950|nr:uncharacterized protein N7506_007768 [Penicillium brevicompactum]KAJ5333985.1 hypothetical protein N7506_007768 [Penicillium brevicompactum]